MSEFVIECKSVSKNYRQGDVEVFILNNIDLNLERGQSMAIMGASGSGKSTLLNLIGGLDRPTAGTIKINGVALAELDDKACALVRNKEIGFVYQLHHLLMEFTAIENTMMPLLIAGQSKKEAGQTATAILERVGMGHRLHHRPSALSGGERQRVAIARALVTKPSCVLMDEPTGNLDSETAERILSLIKELQQDSNTSFVVVTHDATLARRIGVVVELKQGQLLSR